MIYTLTYRTLGALPDAPPMICADDKLPAGIATLTIWPTAYELGVETSTVRSGLIRTETEPTPTAVTGPVAISGTWRRGRMDEGVMGMGLLYLKMLGTGTSARQIHLDLLS